MKALEKPILVNDEPNRFIDITKLDDFDVDVVIAYFHDSHEMIDSRMCYTALKEYVGVLKDVKESYFMSEDEVYESFDCNEYNGTVFCFTKNC